MNSFDQDLIKQLEREGVLQANGKNLELTEEFVERSATYIDSNGAIEEGSIDKITDLSNKSYWFKRSAKGYLKSLREFDLGFTEEELVVVALSLARLEDPSANWAENHFFELPGDALSDFLEESGAALVLVTKSDCEPCERVRRKIQRLIEEDRVPDTLPVIEVSGPDYAETLYEQYDVVGAPTLLLCVNGSIEMRHAGDKHLKQLRSDVGRVYSSSATPG